ncbi:hypothetical protein [Fictibacillus phosphorivorans]|nr:hypothetical protein [Fictibacillus phosphorivorans]
MMKQSKNSLFSQHHPSHYHDNKNDENNCDGCICELFRRLNEECTDGCTVNNQFFYILPKGENQPVGETPIPFRFLRFDSESCCAFFEIRIEQNTVTLQVAVDCHEISGIVPLQ